MPHCEFFHTSDTGDRFIRFSNADGKRWIMPLHQMRMAMNLYQPSGMKGRWVKRLLPYVYRVPFVVKIIHSELINIKLEGSVRELIAQTLGIERFSFAIFEGTPSVHKKTTLQIWHDSKILAYCKLSDNNEIGQLFERESVHLNSLYRVGIKQIPQSLFYGKVGDNHIFIQSTIKTNRSRTIHKWTQLHWNFLTVLHKTTKITCRFEESDLAKSITSLGDYLGNLPPEDATTILCAMERVQCHYQRREIEFSAYHGDFTPWNMFSEKGELFVFDFEYWLSSYLPYMDMFHFVHQVAIVVKKYDAFTVHKRAVKEIGKHFINQVDFNMTYLSYLLSIISFYYHIGNKKFGPNDNGYNQWLNIIKIILQTDQP